MTDKQIIIEDCPHFIGGCCQEYLDGVCENHKCDLKIIRELEQQLDQLKAENDELKVQNIKYMNGNISYQLKNSLYKQTLTEIKEIAEAHKKDESIWNPYRQLDKILQKNQRGGK